jgi:hypothetical protein
MITGACFSLVSDATMRGGRPLYWESGAARALSWFLAPLGTRASTTHTPLLLVLLLSMYFLYTTSAVLQDGTSGVQDTTPVSDSVLRLCVKATFLAACTVQLPVIPNKYRSRLLPGIGYD